MLARALSHDLPMGALRDLWLDHADVSDLLAPEARAHAGSKLVLKPVVWLLGQPRAFGSPSRIGRSAASSRSSCGRDGSSRRSAARAWPSSCTTRSLRWASRDIGWRLCCRRARGSICSSPSLIITAISSSSRSTIRPSFMSASTGTFCGFVISGGQMAKSSATSSSTMRRRWRSPRARRRHFPAPSRRRRSARWTTSSHGNPSCGDIAPNSSRRNFETYTRMNVDPTSACFLDGSVLNNRPFREAISAIRGRPAYRQVDRRLVYIDPDPAPPGAPTHRGHSGLLLGAEGRAVGPAERRAGDG